MREMPPRDKVLEKIKSRGYWKVIIRPFQFKKTRIDTLKEIRALFEDISVRLRGWDYPPVFREYIINYSDYIESVIDWETQIEIWRMYQSGQFAHLFGCIEDWVRSEGLRSTSGRRILSILSTLYRVTEIYEFASRLAQKDLFENDLTLSIILNGMENRKLEFLEFGRPLFREYICHEDKLTHKKEFSVAELISKSSDLALKHVLWIFERFNWSDPSKEILRQDQRKFLEGKL